MITYGSLFSGIGGLDLGFDRAGWTPRWQVENDPFCQQVLEKHWPDVARYGDINELDHRALETVDCIIGGFPCQPFSHAGRRSGADDNRYLWPQMLRLIRGLQPRFVVAENVYGLVTQQQGLALETVYLDLEGAGYEVAPPIVFPAAAVGALHRRDRVWICAHTRHDRGSAEQRVKQEARPYLLESFRKATADANIASTQAAQPDRNASGVARSANGSTVAHPDSVVMEGSRPERERVPTASRAEAGTGGGRSYRGIWDAEPDVGRVAHGVPRGVDRLKSLGNAVVPQAAYEVALALKGSIQ